MPFLILMASVGCSDMQSEPLSVTETSAARVELADRIRFIENYVTFRLRYEKLDYDVAYQNNGGGMVPGPSDWDIRLIAVVPSSDLEGWIPVDTEKSEGAAPEWLQRVPGPIERQEITEWYRNSAVEFGIDRTRSIVAYRNTSTPN